MIPIVRQNADINAKVTDFPVMADNEILVSSAFFTIQGEGPFAGQRALFIRTSGCNFGAKLDDVACNFCDTSFAIKDGNLRSFNDLISQIHETGAQLVVLTGGEPLLQPNVPSFIREVLELGIVLQLETNGSFLKRVSDLASSQKNLHIVCSPKQVGGRYSSAAPPFDYEASRNPVHFKFVVNSVPGNPHFNLPQWVNQVPNSVFWVSPMTIYRKSYAGEVSSIWDSELVDQAACAANYRHAAALVMDIPGLRFTCQLHTLMAVA